MPQDLAKNDGSGGIIAVDTKGNGTVPINCDGMYRGMVTQEADFVVSIKGVGLEVQLLTL